MSTERILVTYLTQAKDLQKKAEGIAVGMTVGSWTDLPLAKQEQLRSYLGEVAHIAPLDVLETGETRGLITISYPSACFTPDIPSLLTGVFGKLSMDGKIKLLDISLPPAFLERFSGPKYGIHGVRERLGVFDRPLFMSIFKSCTGLSLEELEVQFRAQAEGGVDLIKDDEIFFQDDKAPFLTRIKRFKEIGEDVAQKTGKPVLYAANLTGPSTKLIDKAKQAIEAGASCLLFNGLVYGLDLLQQLAEDPDITVPIMAHPALAGAFYPSADYGIAAPLLLGTLQRLAGADLVLFPSPYGNVAMAQTDASQLVQQLISSSGSLKPSFPVPSAGIHPGMVPKLYQDFGLDQVINAGGGVHGHPKGAAAGGTAFLAAIEATLQGKKLSDTATEHEALRLALDKWGGHS
ncbi:2,3-diketo-5-methylthiopentyl-1-phosphate enolase [Brevibacillus daliensis]|uniref:2,3-diketo-5-methylthiopentyl-1-phosphate enolase n=1 Tax=Brevibacillus daliensis TaxID=2892995 RepID=UPI001E579901|nr:2,3-diketo-5-methylthiopentyl-1-phosphate enolase [Brevibacillus daliensis]